jgi:cobalt/nickel transport system permease protein
VAKTITGASGLVRQAIFSEEVAAAPGLLQRLDARVKLVTLLGHVAAAAFVRTIPVLALLYLGAVGLALASRLSLRYFVARVWLFVPIFTGVVVLPATLSLITPGHIVIPLGSWFGTPVGFTAEGLESAGLIVMRVAFSISMVVLLTLTTPWSRLLAALRSLRVPTTIVLVLSMAYRYLFHLLTAVTDMYVARTARTVTTSGDTRSGRRFVAASAGALFGKSHALSEEVYLAMVARGFTGEVRTLDRARLSRSDLVWSAGATLVAAALLWSAGVFA